MDWLKNIFATAENGTLTYEQLNSALTAKGIKIANLSDGGYVSRQKYDDELKARDTRITTLDETIKTRDADLQKLQTSLDGADVDSLKKASKDLADLQKKYDKETKAYEAQLSQQAYEFAVREFASGKNFTSKAAKRDFVKSMIAENLTMKDGKIIGADDFVTSYQADNDDAFVVETQEPAPQSTPKPTFVAPTSQSTSSQEDQTGGFASAFHFTPINPVKK